ncbi:flagellar hook capping FlgD N-terminal domain-containing protein [Clostridium sp. DMHC 10]|uniref:flagellar hook assembly protein FlgD n=1 Tax=Clostridium sp. DMHC 10 TaxID=747377 RepID=UPI00069F359C|nr:flagellar hook capping FlgD N-terminal domain-containing protein [Clostridium sp. DMHC 10]
MSNSFNDLNTIDTSKIASGSSSSTRKTSNTLDQDAFVRILTAEMANQSPDNSQDATQFVAQMAQFSSVEQMLNLNRTMTFNGASSLIGKVVTMKSADSDGNPYRGIVEKVTRNGDSMKVYVDLLDQNGNQIYQEKLDDKGNPVIKDGKPVYLTEKKEKVDSDGKVVTDPTTGQPVYEDVPINKVMTFDYSDVDSASGIAVNIVDTGEIQKS